MARLNTACPRSAIALILLVLLVASVMHVLVLMPVVHRPAIRLATPNVSVSEPTPPPATNTAVAGTHAWPCSARRRERTDAEWAQHIVQVLWCHAAPVPSRAVAELSARLANRSLLDSSLASLVCRDACLAARASTAPGPPTCRFCRCRSAVGSASAMRGLWARPESGAESGAPVAQLRAEEAEQPAPALLGVHAMSRLGGRRGAAAVQAYDAETRRQLRRAGSVHAKARAELARSATNLSAAFEWHAMDACAASLSSRVLVVSTAAAGSGGAATVSGAIGAAFTASLQPPSGARRTAQLVLSATAAYRKCTHGRAGGDTFTLRAYSADVTLPSPLLRQVGRGVDSGHVYAGRYATEGSNPGLADRVPGRSATHTFEPCLGQSLRG